jgi:hypothetical protein
LKCDTAFFNQPEQPLLRDACSDPLQQLTQSTILELLD